MSELIQKAKDLDVHRRSIQARVDLQITNYNRWTLRRDDTCVAYAALAACFVTHPVDLLKVRYQLQGELKPPGKYEVKYGTIPQSVWKIAKHENFGGFYKGFVAGSSYQFLSNLLRVYIYQAFVSRGMTSDMNEKPVFLRNAAACAISGSLGAVLMSPLYLAKIQTQSQACPALAVGWQHKHTRLWWALFNAFRGHKGYFQSGWQGGSSAALRASLAGTLQLLSFTTIQRHIHTLGVEDALINSCISGIISALPVVLLTNPVDVVCTRMYNQELEAYYKSNRECVEKLIKREGWRGLYKGALLNYLRTAPHMVLTLIGWNYFKLQGIELQIEQGSYIEGEAIEGDLGKFDPNVKAMIDELQPSE